MRYSDDYKEKIVNDYKQGMIAKEVMKKYLIKKSTLYDLLKIYKIKKHIEKQLGQVNIQLNILKKQNGCYKEDLMLYQELLQEMNLSHKNEMKYALKIVNKRLSQKRICRILDLDYSTLSGHIQRMKPLQWWEIEELELTPIIIEEFKASDRRLAARKLYYVLKDKGITCSDKRILLIMRINNLKPRRQRKCKKES